jgi:two-component system, LytTR family, sensor kinase
MNQSFDKFPTLGMFEEKIGQPTLRLRRWWTLGLLVASWTVFGLFFASQVLINRAYRGRPLNLGHTLIIWLICAYIWAALTPLILYLSRRLRIERGRLRNLLIHLVASLGFSVIQLSAYIAATSYTSPSTQPFAAVFQEFIVTGLHFNLLTYWALVALSHAADYYRKYQERELIASQLKAQLAHAQLSSLKMQLHPHFLFNTLNAIAVLVRKSRNKEAIDMLSGLSDLLRHSLENIDAQEVSLKEELEFLKLYLEIEQVRFNDRLRVRMEVDQETLDALVPNLILQPLVENAIRHGIGKRSAAGLLEISARRENGRLWLQVRDDGPGIPVNGSKLAGAQIGLTNTRTRLQRLYGEEQTFELRNALGGGAVATLTIPFRQQGDQG